jgi:hypothetical protein
MVVGLPAFVTLALKNIAKCHDSVQILSALVYELLVVTVFPTSSSQFRLGRASPFQAGTTSERHGSATNFKQIQKSACADRTCCRPCKMLPNEVVYGRVSEQVFCAKLKLE